MGGRPQKPTHLLLLGGAQKRNPGRLKGRAKKGDDGKWEEVDDSPAGVGDPPEYFNAEEKERWKEFVEVVPAGVLKRRDRPTVEQIAVLWALIRTRAASSADHRLFASLCGKFGCNAAERSRAPGRPQGDKKKSNSFAELG